METKPVYPSTTHYSAQNQQHGVQVNQPVAVQVIGSGYQYRSEWHSGLFSCLGNIGGCLCVLCCLPCYECQLFTAAGEDICSCLWSSRVALRTKVRVERGIQGSICGDTCTTMWCYTCSLVQIDSELKYTPPRI